jgi:hypothetical protein
MRLLSAGVDKSAYCPALLNEPASATFTKSVKSAAFNGLIPVLLSRF